MLSPDDLSAGPSGGFPSGQDKVDVTAATPTTLSVGTSRGQAKVPAWAFTLQGVSGPIIQAALPPGSYVIPGSQGNPSPARLAPLGKAFTGAMSATASPDGRTLRLQLFGGVCDATWGGLEAETDGAIVVGGWEVDPNPTTPCAAVGVEFSATVRLATPVGDRVIIDAATGQPALPPAR